MADNVNVTPGSGVTIRTLDNGSTQQKQLVALDFGGENNETLVTATVPFPVSAASGVAVALSSPPGALTASTDTSLTFASAIRHLLVQNNSTTPCGVEFGAAATAGSLQVPAGGGTLILDTPLTVLHCFSAAATPVNGSAGLNLVVKGWS